VRCTVAGPTFIYGTVESVSFGGGNTTVIISNATASLNASLSVAEYSILIASGMTVDAAGVSYDGTFNYTDPRSIGFEVKDIRADLTEEANQVNRLNTTWATSGSGSNTPFTVTVSPAPTSLTADSIFSVRFVAAGAGDMTLNVNGLGAKRLRTYTSAGTITNAIIPAGLVSTVTYDVTNDCYIVQNRIPQVLNPAPRSSQTFGVNGTFTCPANVFYVKVTCVGGGGGGDFVDFGGYFGYYPGGAGAVSETYVAVTPSTNYAVVVGAGGIRRIDVLTPATAGGSSSFGGTLASAGGGGAASGAPGSDSSTGTGFVYTGSGNQFGGYGQGGPMGFISYAIGTGGDFGQQRIVVPGQNGVQGFVYVEW
jgi:hypothetical protein